MPEENPEIEQFPSNSNSQQEKPEDEPKRNVKKIASAKRIVKKKSFFDTFLNGTLKVVGLYVFTEILIPAFKNTVSDMVNNSTDMILFGEPKSRRRDRDRTRGEIVSYSRYYDRDRRDRDDRFYDRDRDRDRIYGRARFRSDEIILPTREDANDVVQEMFAIDEQYNAVTVAEFLELVDLPDEYTDHNFGWTNLRDVQIRRVREGYIIDLPEPRALPR